MTQGTRTRIGARCRIGLAVGGLTVALTVPASAQPVTFAMPPSYPTGTGPGAIVNGDFNQDMRGDIAVANAGSNSVTVYLGAASGGFGPAATYAVGTRPVAIAASNINGDSFADLAVVNRDSANVSILLGSAAGTFTAVAPIAIGGTPNCVALADMNTDGRVDLITSNTSASSVSVRLGNGNGGFGAPIGSLTATTVRGLVVGLFNADGLPDVATVGFDQVSIFLGTGGGALGAATNIAIPIFGGEAIATGSFNGDAALDLVAAGTSMGTVAILLGNGSGGFGAPTQFPAGVGARSVAVADLDANGTADLVVADEGDQAIATLSGAGNGTFAPRVRYGTGGRGPVAVAVGAFDTSAPPDVAVVNAGSDSVSLHAGLGAGRLDGMPIYPVGLTPVAVAMGNVDADGDQDVVTANATSGDVSVLLGNNDGTLGPATAYAVGNDPRNLVLTDVNNDTRPDIVVLRPLANRVTVRLANGDGTFGAAIDSTTAANAQGLAIADVDGDGNPDVLTTSGNNLSRMLGMGDGTFINPTLYFMGTNPRSVATGFLDLGPRPDAITANTGANAVGVRLNNGTGGFVAPVNLPVGGSPQVVITTNINGDPYPDIAVCHGLSDNVIVFRNVGNGTGTFLAAQTYPITFGSFCNGLASLDLNLDGREDLAVADVLSRRLTILRNDGNNGFTQPLQHFVVANASGVAGGDLNGDGKRDLVVSNGSNGTIQLFINTTVPPVADLSVTKSDAATTATPGLPLTYTIRVTNNGPSTVTEIELNDLLPPQLQSPTFVPQAGTYVLATTLWTGLNLAAGQSVDMTVSGTVNRAATGTITNTVLVATGPGTTDPDPQNNTASDTDTLVPLTDIGITLTDNVTRVQPLQPITYTSVVTNTGPSDAAGITVADVFPPALQNMAWSCVGTLGATCPAANGTGSIAQVVTVPVGGRLIYTSGGSVTASATGLIENTAFVQIPPGTEDSDPSNNVAHDLDTLEPLAELLHGSRMERSLAAQPGPTARADLFYVAQAPYTSYEVIVDATSGDIGAAAGVRLERLADVPTAALQTSVPVGAGPSRALRWANTTGVTVASQLIRVTSAACGTDCGPDDTYRIRMYDTTFTIGRFNNAGAQATVLILQNPTDRVVHARVHLWNTSGALLNAFTQDLNPKQTTVTGLPSIAPGTGGSITITHDGGYGALAGKTVALELSSGFSFDSPMLPRPR